MQATLPTEDLRCPGRPDWASVQHREQRHAVPADLLPGPFDDADEVCPYPPPKAFSTSTYARRVSRRRHNCSQSRSGHSTRSLMRRRNVTVGELLVGRQLDAGSNPAFRRRAKGTGESRAVGAVGPLMGHYGCGFKSSVRHSGRRRRDNGPRLLACSPRAAVLAASRVPSRHLGRQTDFRA